MSRKKSQQVIVKNNSGLRRFLTLAAVIAIVGLAVASAMVPPEEDARK